jgi:hypothetical protein
MNAMKRSIVFRSLTVLASMIGVIVGCSSTPTEGDLPPTKPASPEDLQNLQKKLETEKVAPGAGYKPPPAVNIPKK